MNKERESEKPKEQEQSLSHYLREHLNKSGVEILMRVVKLETELLLYKTQNKELRQQLDKAQAQLVRKFELPEDIPKMIPQKEALDYKPREQLLHPELSNHSMQLKQQILQQLKFQEEDEDKLEAEKKDENTVEDNNEDVEEDDGQGSEESTVSSMQLAMNNINSISDKKEAHPPSPIKQDWSSSHTVDITQTEFSKPSPVLPNNPASIPTPPFVANSSQLPAPAPLINIQLPPASPITDPAFTETPKQMPQQQLKPSFRDNMNAPRSRYARSPLQGQYTQPSAGVGMGMRQAHEQQTGNGRSGYGQGHQDRGKYGGYAHNSKYSYGNRRQSPQSNDNVNQTQAKANEDAWLS